MSAFQDDLAGFSALDHNASALGPEMTLGPSGALSTVGSASGGNGGAGGVNGHAVAPIMITAPHSNLAIDLVWDNSVADAPAGFTAAVDAAAKELVTLLNTAARTILYIDVGWGELAGVIPLPADAVGASAPNGFLTDYATVDALLSAHSDAVAGANQLPSSTPPLF